MVTLDMIHAAYNEYARLADKAAEIYRQSGVCPLYETACDDADDAFDYYRDLEREHAEGPDY